jgi:hypothetical protein
MLKLKANPTFKAQVQIPVPGGKPVPMTFEFKHMGKDAYTSFIEREKAVARTDEEAIMDIAVGWDGADAPFSAEAVHDLCDNYHGAATAIVETFIDQLTQARRGN